MTNNNNDDDFVTINNLRATELMIGNMTLNEIKELLERNPIFKLLAASSLTPMMTAEQAAPTVAPTNTAPVEQRHPMVGQFVICRCSAAGVHVGYLAGQTDSKVMLTQTRRLWSWVANGGVALSGLAMTGLKSGRVDALLPNIFLTDVIETIPVPSDKVASFLDAK